MLAITFGFILGCAFGYAFPQTLKQMGETVENFLFNNNKIDHK